MDVVLLPEELQLVIFEYAAEDLDTALNLCYVSRSVQYWCVGFFFLRILRGAGRRMDVSKIVGRVFID